MSDPVKTPDWWRLPTLLLWILFFLIGLMPNPVYESLRTVAAVLPQRAMVNSPYLITILFAAYVALFCFHRCQDAGLTPHGAQDRAFQMGLLGLVAFLPVDFRALPTAYFQAPMQDQLRIYVSAGGKSLAWLFMMSLFIRYYLFSDARAFAAIPSFFPSAHWKGNDTSGAAPTAARQPPETATPQEHEPKSSNDSTTPAACPAEDCDGKPV